MTFSLAVSAQNQRLAKLEWEAAFECCLVKNPGTPQVLPHHDRTYLDRSHLGSGDAGGNRQRFIEIFGFDQEISAQLLFGLCEWPIGDGLLAVSHAHRGGGGDRLELMATYVLAAPFQVTGQVHVPLVDSLL